MDKLLLFLGLCCLVYAQNGGRPAVCPNTVEQLVRSGQCPRACITTTSTADRPFCPVCREGCSDVDECGPLVSTRCDDDEICLARGVGGRFICVERIAEGFFCNNPLDISTVIPCEIGLVCRRETIERSVCRAENPQGPCTMAMQSNPELRCDDRGNFQPLQCRKDEARRLYLCQCVEPATGSPVPGSQVEVTERDELPETCDDLVGERCTYQSSLGVRLSVSSGQPFIDLSTCSRCLCRDGEAVLCERILQDSDCDLINPTPGPTGDCTVRGRTVPSGEMIQVDCNLCTCRRGGLACTRRLCEDDEDDEDDEEDPEDVRNCLACGAMRADPVCGDDGRTYPSRCFAVSCRGLDSEDLTPGPCSSRDVCREIPCGDGEVCLRTGGVTCLSREGCRPERLRRCVEAAALTCRMREDDDDDDDEASTEETPTSDDEDPTSDVEDPTSDSDEDPTSDSDEESDSFSFSFDLDDDDEGSVCGRDGRTYSSICNLIQDAPQTEVAYDGRCNRTECLASGEVCGTDGITYDNICELRSNSANARVDYRGECEDEPDEVVDDKCARLRRSGRCAALTDCSEDSRVRPGDGCCPVCGGAVTIGLDRDSLDEYVRLNPSVDTVTDLLNVLVQSRFITMTVASRCNVEASLLDSGDLHMVLENLINSDSICAMAAQEIADRINNPPMGDEITEANPQVLQFATVAQPSPLVDESGNLPANGEVSPTSGAVSAVSFSLAAMLIPIASLLL